MLQRSTRRRALLDSYKGHGFPERGCRPGARREWTLSVIMVPDATANTAS